MADEKPKRLSRLRAAALKADSHPVLVDTLGKLRGRLPGDPRFGDSLSTAGEEPAQVVARRVNALQIERSSALHELGLGALQVWQGLSEASGRGMGDQEVTLLFTDLVGFSSWALEAGDEAALELLRQVGGLQEARVVHHGGRVVKRLGDGVMAAFTEPGPAIDAALEALDAVSVVEVEGHRPRMRAGVHHGRPRKLGGDFLGVDANIAARVGDAAGPDELLVSEPTLTKLSDDALGRLDVGKPRKLKAPGAPRELCVQRVRAA